MSEDDFTEVLDTNLTGAYRVAKRAVRGMMRLRRGRMIFISSVVGLLGSAGQANYAASKAGLVGLARSLARELGSRGHHRQRRGPRLRGHRHDGRAARRAQGRHPGQVPLGRLAAADEVAAAVAFLACDGRGLHHRRGHPGRRRPRHGPLSRRTRARTEEQRWESWTASGSW